MHNLYFCILKTLKVNYNSDPKIDNEKRRRFAFRRASFWSIFAFVVIAALVFNKDVKFWNVEVKSAHMYLGVENPTKFQLKSIPLQRVITPSLCIQKGTTKHAGRGNQSPDHIIIF